MVAVIRKTFLAFVLGLVMFTTSAWQPGQDVLAQSQAGSTPETPLYRGLTWSSLGPETGDIRVNVAGETISLAGERYQAAERFPAGLPEGVLNYYSNGQLAKAGWASYDAFDSSDGAHDVFYHEASGVYLSVEFLHCPDAPAGAPASLCVAIWKSGTVQSGETVQPNIAPMVGSFGKISPTNGTTGLDPNSITLSWGTYTDADKYKYCVHEGRECEDQDPNWTSTFSQTATITGLAYNKTYSWQAKATTCINCVPKPWVAADNDTPWKFATKPLILFTISGSVGTDGATLTYDNAGSQFVLSDAGGNYSIVVPLGWSGTVKPYKIGFSFTPASRPYSNLLGDQTAQDYAPQACPACADADTTGVFRPGNGLLYLKNLNVTGFADVAINYGLAGDYPVVGDWDGNGTATIGIYRDGSFYLRNSNTLGFAELVFPFGQVGDQPVAGDWDGNGTDTIGVFRPSTAQFLLRNSNSEGTADTSFFLGNPGDIGLAGDWNGDGTDTTGVFRPINGVIFLKNANSTGIADIALNYGLAGDRPITGDWNNDGIDTIGVYRNGSFYLRNSNTIGFAEIIFALGIPGDMPIAGDWDNRP
jgi:hypothetical protein